MDALQSLIAAHGAGPLLAALTATAIAALWADR